MTRTKTQHWVYNVKFIALLLVLYPMCVASADSWWRFEDAETSTEVVAPFIYDPLTKRSQPNRGSWKPDSKPQVETIDYQPGTSFTLEAYVKLDDDPKKDVRAISLGEHAVGARLLRQWNQTYWAGFSNQTPAPAWQTGHYITISRLVAPTPGKKPSGTLTWRHLALVYHAPKNELTVWLDHWQNQTQKLKDPLGCDGQLQIGRDFPGLIDEARFTPRALQPHEFLRASQVELTDVDFDSPDTVFPRDAGHLDIRRHFGAVGDGVHDDTAAFQRAMRDVENHTIVFVPKGTYLVSDTIYWRQWKLLMGEGESKTTIQLRDRCPGYNDPKNPRSVVRTHFNNNQSFENSIQHLTVDTGRGNPGAIGIRYNAHNTGELSHVIIRSGDGTGVIGLDLSETEFGPAMVRHVTIDGFNVGIQTPGNVSHATMEHITLRNQKQVGFRNHMPVSLRHFRSSNQVPAIDNSGWMAQLTLLDGQLDGNDSPGPAIRVSKGAAVDLRRIRIKGYATEIESDEETPSITQNENGIDQLLIGQTYSLFDQPAQPLDLPVEEAPELFQEPPAMWVLPDASGEDDTAAIQKALDSGAATVYFRNRETYRVSAPLRIPATVRRIVGMKATIQADPRVFGLEKPLFRIEGGEKATSPLHIDHVSVSFYPKQGYGYEIASPRDVVIRWSSGWVRNTAQATGRLFIEEQMGWVHLNHPQRAWIRQLDTEGHRSTPENYQTYLINRGGMVWVLGMKTEWFSVHAETTDGGRTEILGGFFRDHVGSEGIPYFKTIDSDLSANWLQYAWRPGATRSLQAIETQGEITRKLEISPKNAVIGRYRAGNRGDSKRNE